MTFFNDLWRKFFPAKETATKPPAWASFFSDKQFDRFVALVGDHFRREKRRYTLGDGVVHVHNGEDDKQQLGLLNLAQLCAHSEEHDWPTIVGDHFRTLDKSQREQKVLEQRVDDFARVSELLAVRLWPKDYVNELGRSKIVHRVNLPGTISALVFDLPSSIRNVSPDEAKAWGRPMEELFEIALANVEENCIPDRAEQELSDGITVKLLSDESFFVASHALLLDRHPDFIGQFGALVGIPHRHVLLSYPIEDASVIKALSMLIPIIAGMEREGPGSISPLLYWYQAGEFTNLPYRIDRQALHFTPPDEFVSMVRLLGEA